MRVMPMKLKVYVVRRRCRGRRRYWLKWKAPDAPGWLWEATGETDRQRADEWARDRRAELNGEKPVVKPIVAWEEATEMLAKSMLADNLRPNYIRYSCLLVRLMRRMFPDARGPAEITPTMAQAFKAKRAEQGLAPWTIKSNLSILRSLWGRWWGKRTIGILDSNPFADVRAPKVDEPDVRIITSDEAKALFGWLQERWNGWKLPLVYLRVKLASGWRATEVASLKSDDLLPDGYVRVASADCKTRRNKLAWLPAGLYADLLSLGADGYAFGRFSAELRLHRLAKREPHHAARVEAYSPARLVGWLQDELQRFCAKKPDAEPFTLHDFRKTAITEMQMAGVSEKEVSTLVGATPEVIRKHYENLEKRVIAKRIAERREAMRAPATILIASAG